MNARSTSKIGYLLAVAKNHRHVGNALMKYCTPISSSTPYELAVGSCPLEVGVLH